jgi:hypothetical protein
MVHCPSTEIDGPLAGTPPGSTPLRQNVGAFEGGRGRGGMEIRWNQHIEEGQCFGLRRRDSGVTV